MALRELSIDMNLSSPFKQERNWQDDNDDDDESVVLPRKRTQACCTSTKLRRRPAVLLDDDERDEDEHSPSQLNLQLPPCDDSSSSDDSSRRDDDDKTPCQTDVGVVDEDPGWGGEWGVGTTVGDFDDHLPTSSVCVHETDHGEHEATCGPSSECEEELLEAAFFAPASRYSRAFHSRDEIDEPQQDNVTQSRPKNDNVVDLCSDDDEEDEVQNVSGATKEHSNEPHPFFATRPPHRTAVHMTTMTHRCGLRTEAKSPRFNVNSRAACLSCQPSTLDRVASHPTSPPVALASTTTDVPVAAARQYVSRDGVMDQDDIVDCWSDDDGNPVQLQPRRVTDAHDHGHSQRPSLFQPTFAATTMQSFKDEPVQPAPVAHRVTQPQQHHPQSLYSQRHALPQRPRRVRDATLSDTTRAGSVVGRAKTLSAAVSATPFVQSGNSLWYRTHASQPSVAAGQPPRNDLIGGSGVGAGKYTMYNHGNEHADDYEPSVPPPPAAMPRRSTSSRGSRSNRSSVSKKRCAAAGPKKKKKKSWGGGRKKYYRKKSGNHTNQAPRRGRRTSSNPDYSRQDADLKHVGGANIIF